MLGGNGYTNDYDVNRYLRDALLYKVGAGTQEIRRMLIGREFNADFGYKASIWSSNPAVPAHHASIAPHLSPASTPAAAAVASLASPSCGSSSAPPRSPVLARAERPTTESTEPSGFQFYDPRGLGAKVRTRSRSSTPQASSSAGPSQPGSDRVDNKYTPRDAHEVANSPGGTFSDCGTGGVGRGGYLSAGSRGAAAAQTSRESSLDPEGDTRMRESSEEPHSTLSSTTAVPTKIPGVPSLPPSPTPLARSPPEASPSYGIPLPRPGANSGLQRQPSARAKDAFSRLRIGSFGTSPSNGSTSGAIDGMVESPSATTAYSGFPSSYTSNRALSPEDLGRVSGETAAEGDMSASFVSTASGSSRGAVKGPAFASSNNPLSSSVGPGMSPAASFLSAFSPPTSVTGGEGLTGAGSARRVLGGGGSNQPFRLLPPSGDEEGFVLPIEAESDADGREGEWVLGRELGSGGMGVVREAIWRRKEPKAKSRGASPVRSRAKLETTQGRKRIAVKIVRRDLAASGPAAAGSALEAFGLSPPHRASGNASASALPGGGGSVRPFPGSRAASFNQPSSSLRNPSRDRILGTSSSSPTGNLSPSSVTSLERNRSTSSPIRPPQSLVSGPPAALSLAGHDGFGPGSRPGTLSPIEQSPLPSPGLVTPAGGPGRESPLAPANGVEPSSGSTQPHHAHSLPPPFEPSPEQTLLDSLLHRELTLWSQLTSLSNPPHRNLVPLLSTARTDDFEYILMPLCDGGSLLSYLNATDRVERDVPPRYLADGTRVGAGDETEEDETDSSLSRERPGRRSNGRNTFPTAAGGSRPRASFPFATTATPTHGTQSAQSSPVSSSGKRSRLISPPPSSASATSDSDEDRGLPLAQAGEIFGEIVAGLKWLHEEARVVHKDLKLENLLSCWEVSGRDDPDGEARDGFDGDDDDVFDDDEDVEMGEGRGQGVRPVKIERVWKIADFGLSETIPPPATPTPAVPPSNSKSTTAGIKSVKGVQPLSSLARGGSLSRPHLHHHASSHLSASVGPSNSSTKAPAAPNPHAGLPHTPSPPSTDLTAHLHPIGSLPYSSPESLRSPIPIIDPSVDVWALGCVLYALVQGVLPIWDEWEYRLRARLVKGEWEVPVNLAPTLPGRVDATGRPVRLNPEHEKEKEAALEVLKGCLEKDVARRWTAGQVAASDWLRVVRERRETRRHEEQAEEARRRARRRSLRLKLKVQTQQALHPRRDSDSGDVEMGLRSPASISTGLPPSPARGRPSHRPLPLLSSFSSTTSSNAASSSASTSTSRSSSRSISVHRPSPVSHDSPSSLHSLSHGGPPPASNPSTLRRPSRSTSRSSAYAHQGVDPTTQTNELKERGRSQRRLRWDEEKETSRRRRSESRDALSLDSAGAVGDDRGRSSSRGSRGRPPSGAGKSRDRTGERLESVREPY
ncbi:hypothetical protein JCM10212_004121 [Sporobolomyces blumeae]